MEGLRPLSVSQMFFVRLKVRILSQIWKNVANMHFLGSTLKLFHYYIRGIFSIYYNITWGEGSPETPKSYYVIYGRPLSSNYWRLCQNSQIPLSPAAPHSRSRSFADQHQSKNFITITFLWWSSSSWHCNDQFHYNHSLLTTRVKTVKFCHSFFAICNQ